MPFEDMIFGSYDKAEHNARRAHELYEDGKISQALLELEAALEISPSNSAWHFDKALALDAINRFEEAIAEYETALELNPDDPDILNSLGIDYTRTGQYDLAISTFEHIQELAPTFEPCYCNRIIAYTEMEQHSLAEEMFYLAQQIKPDCALCYYNIGNSLFIRGQYEKAIHCWQKTAKLEPTHPQINYRIAQAHWADGGGERSREYFLAELRTNPGDVDVILDFGLFLLEVGDIESAKEKFNRILDFKPDSAVASFYLGEIALDNNDYEQAVKLFNEALEKDSTLAGPRYRLAQCTLRRGWEKETKAYLVSEVEREVGNAQVLASMASMFLRIGEPDYATACLLKALDIDNASADAYYYLGFIQASKKRYEEAAEFFGHTLDIKPEHVLALRDSAIVSVAMGKLNDAVEKIKKARLPDGSDPQLKRLERKLRLIQATERIGDFLCRFKPRFISHLLSRIWHLASRLAHHG